MTSRSRARISGFGRYSERDTELLEVLDTDGEALVRTEPLLPRGAGRSYGDCAQAPRVTRLVGDSEATLDPSSRLLRAPAQLTIRETFEWVRARGFHLAVVPGTGLATLGGCVAADVHGKNHHRAGTFGQAVEGFELLTPALGRVEVTARSDPELFLATIGGMGLTGIITKVSLRLAEGPVAGIRRVVRARGDLEAVVRELVEARSTHSVAFVDPMARGRSLGRGMVELGEPTSTPVAPRRLPRISIPELPTSFVRRPLVRAFDDVVLGTARLLERLGPVIVPAESYFFPLDGVAGWNRLYGPKGFVQLQVLVPDLAPLTRIVELLASRCPTIGLGVLKVMGSGAAGLLSFPRPGLCLALDLPVREGLLEALDRAHDETCAAGGRLYLAKDATMRPLHFDAIYGDVRTRFLRVKERVDPRFFVTSDQSCRIGLTPRGR
ncbi:MAG: FAD-binding oxidoreductase [Deltaproteobacteria bacterium]|nr:FAD-binding oxidoreductase [Deltaproteobacteria bacterium]